VTATPPVVCEEVSTVDQDGGSDVADIVAVSPDGSDSVDGRSAVSERDWMSIPADAQGRPFSIHVRPIKQCSSWKFSRVFFEIKGAYMLRIRIGNVYVVDWVSYSHSRCFCRCLD